MASHNELPDRPNLPVPIPFEWEYLEKTTARAKVFGGWIVNTISTVGEALVFVPDRNHEWEITKPE